MPINKSKLPNAPGIDVVRNEISDHPIQVDAGPPKRVNWNVLCKMNKGNNGFGHTEEDDTRYNARLQKIIARLQSKAQDGAEIFTLQEMPPNTDANKWFYQALKKIKAQDGTPLDFQVSEAISKTGFSNVTLYNPKVFQFKGRDRSIESDARLAKANNGRYFVLDFEVNGTTIKIANIHGDFKTPKLTTDVVMKYKDAGLVAGDLNISTVMHKTEYEELKAISGMTLAQVPGFSTVDGGIVSERLQNAYGALKSASAGLRSTERTTIITKERGTTIQQALYAINVLFPFRELPRLVPLGVKANYAIVDKASRLEKLTAELNNRLAAGKTIEEREIVEVIKRIDFLRVAGLPFPRDKMIGLSNFEKYLSLDKKLTISIQELKIFKCLSNTSQFDALIQQGELALKGDARAKEKAFKILGDAIDAYEKKVGLYDEDTRKLANDRDYIVPSEDWDDSRRWAFIGGDPSMYNRAPVLASWLKNAAADANRENDKDFSSKALATSEALMTIVEKIDLSTGKGENITPEQRKAFETCMKDAGDLVASQASIPGVDSYSDYHRMRMMGSQLELIALFYGEKLFYTQQEAYALSSKLNEFNRINRGDAIRIAKTMSWLSDRINHYEIKVGIRSRPIACNLPLLQTMDKDPKMKLLAFVEGEIYHSSSPEAGHAYKIKEEKPAQGNIDFREAVLTSIDGPRRKSKTPGMLSHVTMGDEAVYSLSQSHNLTDAEYQTLYTLAKQHGYTGARPIAIAASAKPTPPDAERVELDQKHSAERFNTRHMARRSSRLARRDDDTTSSLSERAGVAGGWPPGTTIHRDSALRTSLGMQMRLDAARSSIPPDSTLPLPKPLSNDEHTAAVERRNATHSNEGKPIHYDKKRDSHGREIEGCYEARFKVTQETTQSTVSQDCRIEWRQDRIESFGPAADVEAVQCYIESNRLQLETTYGTPPIPTDRKSAITPEILGSLVPPFGIDIKHPDPERVKALEGIARQFSLDPNPKPIAKLNPSP